MILIFSSCAKDELPVIQFSDRSSENTVPEEFTKKIVLETMEATWCPYSPEGDHIAEQNKEEFGANRFEYVVYHYPHDDIMHLEKSLPNIRELLNGSFPCGRVDRLGDKPIYRNLWAQTATQRFENEALCGLALDASHIEGNVLNLKVDLGIGASELDEWDLPEDVYKLQVLVIEKEQSGEEGHWQVSAYNEFAASPFYQRGNPIKDYVHRNVLVDILGEPTGDIVDIKNLSSGSKVSYNYQMDLSGCDSDLRFVAMVYIHNPSTADPTTRRNIVLNSQFVVLGSLQPFD